MENQKKIIICAAVKYKAIRKDANREDVIIIPGIRHGNCYCIWNEMKKNFLPGYESEDGFVDANMNFYNRREAFDLVCETGQISPTAVIYKRDHLEEELYSEDLY